MTERKTIAALSVITDDDCGMYHIGEIDGGFGNFDLHNHIRHHGSEELVMRLAKMTHDVVAAAREVSIEDAPKGYEGCAAE